MFPIGQRWVGSGGVARAIHPGGSDVSLSSEAHDQAGEIHGQAGPEVSVMRRGFAQRSSSRLTPGVFLRCAVVACVVAIVLAGCGSSGDTASSAKSKTSTVTLGTRSVSGVGTVLVDGHGMTLYTFTSGGQPVPCTGPCASAWPPLRVPAGSTSKDVTGVKGLGVTAQGQVTENSLPLYRYSQDNSPGQARGEGIRSFGGVWHVVTVGAASGGNRGTTPSSSTPGNPYGY